MIPVSLIYDDAKAIVGSSSDEVLFRRLTSAMELLSNKGDFDPLMCGLDVCVSDRLVALPREVDTVIACNMVGQPAIARDQLFRFHLNGPGDCGPQVLWTWYDMGNQACTFRELPAPSKILGFCEKTEDQNCEIWVEGLDKNNNVIRTKVGNDWVNGWKVPVFVNAQALPADAPIYARITRVRKAVTAGAVRISTPDNDDQSGTLLGVYQWDETEPRFRRIKLAQKVPWIRIFVRRRTYEIRSKLDLITIKNREAILVMLRAIKNYHQPGMLPEAEGLEATAARWLAEEQHAHTAPVVHPIQVHDEKMLGEPADFVN